MGGAGRVNAAVAGRLDGGERSGPAHESAPVGQARRGQGHAGVWRRARPGARGRRGREVYILQATMDTRPEDLLVTPVIAGAGNLRYVASTLVAAMLRGGIAIIDEGNR